MPTKKGSKSKNRKNAENTSTIDVIKRDTEAAEAQEAIRNTIADFPIVGIGASAGGLAAFEAFFSGMPADRDPGMAFVLVQHLAPDHKSILTELMQRYTSMQVFEVEDGIIVNPNCVYIIPPNCDIALLRGALHVLVPSAPHGQRLPIDFFFRSLAQDQHERAICIILSGTGSDGVLGLRAIKGEGGMAMAQSPASTEFDGMPSSAIATGLVDYELSPADMPTQLIAYAAYMFGNAPLTTLALEQKPEKALQKIFVLLRMQTGHDFSQYKTNTVHRHIARRMAVKQVDSINDYVNYLQHAPAEVEALFKDMLIGVTSFFRDPDAFQMLEDQVISKLVERKPNGSTIRVWTPGCSTGEEAYSIAMLLYEQMEIFNRRYIVQIFATDIDCNAITVARSGCYPASIAMDTSPKRLARFFTLEPDGKTFRIQRNIRDMLVFSEQDIIKDPPFSKLDLISCRNMLIYLGASLQKKLIPLFHYALNPGGYLFLGKSETVGEFDTLFGMLDRNTKLFFSKESVQYAQHTAFSPIFSHIIPPASDVLPLSAEKARIPAKQSLRDITEQALLQRENLVGVLVNNHGDILFLHGHAGMYLEPTPGEAGRNNILKMARKGLQYELTSALHKAVSANEVVYRFGIQVQTNGQYTTANLTVIPAVYSSETTENDLFLVILEKVPEGMESLQLSTSGNGQADTDALIIALKQELLSKDEYLQSVNEQLESINEELRSSNEEMQSVNEELQSTNEELETSKEELQSINEELTTVNNELQTKVADLSCANNDLSNLLACTGIATIFINHQQRVMRFTPSATKIINLILSDVGRPLAHVVTNLDSYDHLTEDIQKVLDTLIPMELEVMTKDGRWYTMRIQPYRTLDNVIEGAVLTFVDVTDIVKAREVLAKVNEPLRLAVVVRDSHDAITVQALDGRILAWNPAACRIYGWSESEALLMSEKDRIPKNQNSDELFALHNLASAETLESYRTQRTTKNGAIVDIWMTATALKNAEGKMYAIATTERAVSNTSQE